VQNVDTSGQYKGDEMREMKFDKTTFIWYNGENKG